MKASCTAHLPCKVAARVAALLVACLVAILLLGGCAGEEEEGESPTAAGTPAATVIATATPAGTPVSTAAGPGIKDTEIIIGAHSPLSGAFGAVYAMIPRAQEAYYKYINETQGGVCGRKIVFKVEDDGGQAGQEECSQPSGDPRWPVHGVASFHPNPSSPA